MAEPLEMVEEGTPPTGEEVQSVDETGGEPSGETTEVEGAEPSGDDPTAEPVAKPKGVQERIDQITREKHEAREEAAHWRGIAEGRAGKNVPSEPETTKPAAAPRAENFETDEAYQDARLEYAAEQGAVKGAASAKREFQEERQKELAEKKATALEKAIGDDLMKKAKAVGAYAGDVMLDAAGDQVKAVVEVLVADPAESQRIGALPPMQQAVAIGEIRARLKVGPPLKKITNAPSPPAMIGSGGSPPKKTPETMSQDELFDKWTKDELERRGLKP